MSDYPEHEKLQSISDHSQVIGEFVEWLAGEKGIHLGEWERQIDCGWRSASTVGGVPRLRCRAGQLITHMGEENGDECEVCDGTGYVERIEPRMFPVNRGITNLLADFFDIDLDKIEVEKRAMLDHLRAAHQ